MRFSSVMVCTICSMALLTAGLGSCDKGEKGSPASSHEAKPSADTSVIKVIVADVVESDYEDWATYSADLRGMEDANLTAPFQGGRVQSVKPVGTFVKAGEPLCDIESEKYEAALQAAQAHVDVTKGDLERAKINVEKGSLGRAVLDGTNLAYQNARMARAAAKRAFEDCRCESPFDGILVSTYINRYETVGPGVPTVRISKLSQLEARIAIPESDAFSIKEGMKAEFRLLHTLDHLYNGKITSVDRAVESRSRTISAKILLVNNDGLLKPGMVGKARILKKSYSKSIVIPSTALLHLQNGTSVMIVENGFARQRIVDVAATTGDNVLITKGLSAGDHLITTGAFQVSDGTRVIY